MYNEIVRYSVICLAVLSLARAESREKYDIKNIPDTLLPSDAVIRSHSIRFEVKSKILAVEQVTYSVTIFTALQREKSEISLEYDKFRQIEEITGTLFDAQGNEVKDLDDEDVKDYSSVSGYSLHDDARIKHAALYHDTYPYTVEYSYEIRHRESFNWPVWVAQEDKFPVQHSRFEVLLPKTEQLRFWTNRSTVKPSITEKNSSKIYLWEANHLPLLTDDPTGSDMFFSTIIVRIAPKEFEVEGYKGSMESWKSFGSWYGQLLKGKNILSNEIKQEIASIVGSQNDKRTIVKNLYEFLQTKTRYVSIQLGLGSWQPFDASYVHSRGYGDCKALTNYMQTLLSYSGIHSYPVLIQSGLQITPMIPEFPSNQFNHMILCIPTENDSIWLECTSRSMPFGRLGYSTEGRNALLISSEGGTIVRTPETTSFENTQSRNATFIVQTNGNLHASITTTVTGNQQLDAQSFLLYASDEDRKKWILERLKFPGVLINSYSIDGLENKSTKIHTNVTAELYKYSTLSSNRLFFNPSVLTQRTYVPPERKNRKAPVKFYYPYADIDSFSIVLPRQYVIETIPKEIILEAPFGSFRTSIKAYGDSMVTYTRFTEIRTLSIPAERYDEYRTFCQNIVKADRSQIVLRRKD